MDTDKPTNEDSAYTRALLGARQLILEGELAPGARLSELALVNRLGVSRTPVRIALVRLEDEGFVATLPGGGYIVRSFSEKEIFDAIDLRGVLEGTAARCAAERGVTRATLAQMKRVLDDIEKVLEAAGPQTDVSGYMTLNEEFHRLMVQASENSMVRTTLERLVRLPFAAPNAFTLARSTLISTRDLLIYAQRQHHALVEAIEAGEGTRAEALAREHSRVAASYLKTILSSNAEDLGSVLPHLRLISASGLDL